MQLMLDGHIDTGDGPEELPNPFILDEHLPKLLQGLDRAAAPDKVTGQQAFAWLPDLADAAIGRPMLLNAWNVRFSPCAAQSNGTLSVPSPIVRAAVTSCISFLHSVQRLEKSGMQTMVVSMHTSMVATVLSIVECRSGLAMCLPNYSTFWQPTSSQRSGGRKIGAVLQRSSCTGTLSSSQRQKIFWALSSPR